MERKQPGAKAQLINDEQLPMKGQVDIKGPPQSFVYMIVSTALLAIGMIYACWPRTVPILDALTNGTPRTGELGYGRFLIFGTTISFEYPFRLAHPTVWTKLVPWSLYFLHQIGQFVILTKARAAKASGALKWTPVGEWNPYSWSMFRWNIVFVIAHFVQSQMQYDGLAGSFSEISSKLNINVYSSFTTPPSLKPCLPEYHRCWLRSCLRCVDVALYSAGLRYLWKMK
jgi:hypothetical protein